MSNISNSSQHFYNDQTGKYRIDQLFPWINKNPQEHKNLPVTQLLEYVIHDTWSDIKKLHSNFRIICEDPVHRERMKKADLLYPIVITNFNRLIDGVHRLFKAIFEKKEKIKVVFISQKQLDSIRTVALPKIKESVVPGVSFPDQYLYLPLSSLPEDEQKKRDLIEDYFPDHLPTARKKEDKYEICLERPGSPYGCYQHDKGIYSGLNWWGSNLRIRDIPKEYKLLKKGILALEEQWVPLSWSHTFTKKKEIPKEVILLHLDDHQDLMSPRIGKRLDGVMVDYITGSQIDFLQPNTIRDAIVSGAIGKGSILTPLVWSIPKIHVRHLTFRPHPNTTYHIHKTTYSDDVLFPTSNRIGLNFLDTSWENLTHQSNYVVTNSIETWLKNLPDNVLILLHFDLDYFNNRFDGHSDWKNNMNRSHNPSLEKQLECLHKVISSLKQKKLSSRIIDTSIGISPGFYPTEYWEKMVTAIDKEMRNIGIDLNLQKEKKMVTNVSNLDQGNKVLPSGMTLRKRKKISSVSDEEKTKDITKIAKKNLQHSRSQSTIKKKNIRKKRKIKKSTSSTSTSISTSNSTRYIDIERIQVDKMSSNKFEGWKIKLDNSSCGYIKFIPKTDEIFKKHVTVDFKIPQQHRGKHIGRIALDKAIQQSVYSFFVAHLRKSNIASKKALAAVGFTVFDGYPGNQLCMTYESKNSN